jgi:hypothetical protein
VRRANKILVLKPEGKIRRRDVDGIIILKWILSRACGCGCGRGLHSSGCAYGLEVDRSEQCNELSCFINARNYGQVLGKDFSFAGSYFTKLNVAGGPSFAERNPFLFCQKEISALFILKRIFVTR